MISVVKGVESAGQPPPLRVFLLGGFRADRLRGDSYRAVVWPRPVARTLLKLLAVTGRPLHREQIVDALWSDMDPAAGLARLRRTLYLARHAIEPEPANQSGSSLLVQDGDLIRLNTRWSGGPVWVDAEWFEEQAEAALKSTDCDSLRGVLACYGGPLLPEDRYDAWPVSRRERLAELQLSLTVLLADGLAREGRLQDAVDRLRDAVRSDPVQEDLTRRLMRLYIRLGTRHSALREYHRCRQALENELGVKPDAETEALYHELTAASRGSVAMRAGTADGTRRIPPPGLLREPPPLPLVGRARQLGEIVERLTGATDIQARQTAPDRARVVLIGGEAGVGKTRLMMEAARTAHQDGMVVLWGAAHEDEERMPYAPLIDAFEGHLSQCTAEECARIARDCPEITRLLPSLPAQEVASSGNPDTERLRLMGAIVRLMNSISRSSSRGLLLVLDDLHATDPVTMLVLRHLIRQSQTHSWSLALLFRPDDVRKGSPFQCFLDALSGSEVRIDLLPLQPGETSTLVSEMLPGGRVNADLARETFGQSLGNPLFITHLIRDLEERGALALEDGEWRARSSNPWVPVRIRDILRARIDRMDPSTRRLLELAATAGMEFSFQDVLIAGAHAFSPPSSDDALLDGLDEALASRIVQETDAGYGFRHPLIRAAVYQSLSQYRRSRYHLALARAIESVRPDDVEALAFHFDKGGDQERAILYLERAGDRARHVYANETAERYYRRLAALLDGNDISKAMALKKLGAVLAVLGKSQEAIPLLDEALALCEEARGPEAIATVAAQLGQIHAVGGSVRDGVDRIRSVVDRYQLELRPASLARLFLALAGLFFASSEYAKQLAAADRAKELAEATVPGAERASLVAEAQTRRGVALGLLGNVSAAREALEEAIPLAEEANDLEILGSALNSVASAYMAEGELEKGRAVRERAAALAERTGAPMAVAFALALLGHVTFLLGDWKAARAHLARAVEIIESLDTAWNSAYPFILFGQLEAGAGHWPCATTFVERGILIAERSDDLQALRFGHWVLAEGELWNGKPTAALRRLAPLVDREGLEEEQVTSLLPLVAWARFETATTERETEAAVGLAARSVERARAQKDYIALGDALRVYGRLLSASSRADEAHQALIESIDVSRSLPCPQSEARGLYELGIAYTRASRDSRRAIECLARAADLFRVLGAEADLTRAESVVLQAGGRDVSSVPSAGPTDAEWERISPLLPRSARTGRPRADDRRTVSGILHVLQTECRWQDMPSTYGSYVTAWRRYRAWESSGAWNLVRKELNSTDLATK